MIVIKTYKDVLNRLIKNYKISKRKSYSLKNHQKQVQIKKFKLVVIIKKKIKNHYKFLNKILMFLRIRKINHKKNENYKYY